MVKIYKTIVLALLLINTSNVMASEQGSQQNERLREILKKLTPIAESHTGTSPKSYQNMLVQMNQKLHDSKLSLKTEELEVDANNSDDNEIDYKKALKLNDDALIYAISQEDNQMQPADFSYINDQNQTSMAVVKSKAVR